MEKRDYRQIVDDILNYLDGCRNVKFSSTQISVNRDEIYELVNELRDKTPEDIKNYAKIVKQKQQIIADAKHTAEEMINSTTEQMHKLINESEIIFRAKDEAGDIINRAVDEGQQILDDAVAESDEIRLGAIKYTDDVLSKLQTIITSTMDNVTTKYDAFMKSLNSSLEVVVANRNQLYAQAQPVDETQYAQIPEGEAYMGDEAYDSVDSYQENPQEFDPNQEQDGLEDYTVDINGFEQ